MTYTCRPMCSAADAHFGIDSIIKFKLRLGNVTNVSETIRKPPLVKAKTASGKHKKIRRRTIFVMADRIISPGNVARGFGMTWHWIRQCNVACGSGIMSLHSLGGSTLQYGTWLWDDMSLNSLYDSTLQCYTSHVALELFNWIRQVAAPCNVALGSGIMSLNSPGGSTLQCDSRLRDDMLAISLLHSTKRPPY